MKTLLLALTVIFFAGCSTRTGDVVVKLDAAGENRIAPSDYVNIATDPSVSNRTELGEADKHNDVKLRILYDTGTIWRRVFIGSDDAPARFEVQNTSLRYNVAGLGFTARYTYEIDGVLHYNGNQYPVKGQGTRAAALMGSSAQRQAVELAIVDAARNCRGIIEAISRTAPTPSTPPPSE